MGLIWRTFKFMDKQNFNLLYKSLVRPHIKYGKVVWSTFCKADINLIGNMQRKATHSAQKINKPDY